MFPEDGNSKDAPGLMEPVTRISALYGKQETSRQMARFYIH